MRFTNNRKMVEELLKQLEDEYNLNFYDLDYKKSDDREEMIRQIEDLCNLCSCIVSELEDFNIEQKNEFRRYQKTTKWAYIIIMYNYFRIINFAIILLIK